MTLPAMGVFWLEAGNPESSVRYVLTIGILLDEVGIVVFLVQLYQRLGGYQKEKMEAQYQREREQESGNFRKMPCPFCVSDDFAVVSRIVDVGEVIEIIAE